MINDRQLAFVKNYLTGNGVTNAGLRDNLLDHYCCVIEEGMHEGKAFDHSFSEAVDRISPDGPEKIQADLNYLSTIKRNIMLRKLVYLSSYISVLTALTGGALRIPQIISADLALLMTMAGLLLFSVTTVPFFFYDRYLRSVKELKEG